MQPSRLTLAILWSVWCAQRVRANLELLKDIGDVDVRLNGRRTRLKWVLNFWLNVMSLRV